MIPIKLSIKGLFSYQEEQVIDFNPLISSQIFGVFGGVGSGKSSILDAITFALYGELDRLGMRDSRGYNMMNLKSNDLLIDFEFKTGPEEKKYRFTTVGKRSSKRFDEVKTFVRKAYEWTDEQWIPLEDVNAEKIIGISYQNFRRTVIIPQGKFQEFLQLGAKDRSEMLKEIFNLGKYDLSFKTGHLLKINENNLAGLEGEISHYKDQDHSILKEKEAKLKLLVEENIAFRKVAEENIKSAQKMTNLKEQFRQKKRIEEDLNKLKNQEKDYKQLALKINQIQECLVDFKPLIDKQTDLNNQIKVSKNNLSEMKESLLQVQKSRDSKNIEHKKTKSIIDKKIQLYSEIDEVHKIIEIKTTEKNILKHQARLEDGNKIIVQLNTELVQLKESSAKEKEHLKSLKKNKPDYKKLNLLAQWYNEYDRYKKIKVEVDHDLESHKKAALEIIKSNKDQVALLIDQELTSTNLSKISQKSDFDLSNILKQEKEKLAEILQGLNEDHINLQAHLQLESLAHTLVEGHACPLCGSDNHPEKLVKGDAQTQMKDLQKKVIEVKRKRELIDQSILVCVQNDIKEEEIEKSIAKTKLKEAELNEEIKKHLTAFAYDPYSPEDKTTFAKAYQNASKIESEIEQKELALEKMEALIQSDLTKLDKYKSGLKKIESDNTTDISTRDTLLEQIKFLSFEDLNLESEEQLNNKAELWLNNVKKAEVQYIDLEKKLAELNSSIHQLTGRIMEEEKQLIALTRSEEGIQSDIKSKLTSSEISDITHVIILLKDIDSLSSYKDRLQQYNSNLKSLNDQLLLITQSTKGLTFDLEKYDLLLEEVAKNKIQLKEQGELIGSSKQEVDSLRKDLAEKERLQKEIKKVGLRNENLKVLRGLFKANGFVDFISSVYLEQLCHAANTRFYALTKQQLKLELTEKNDFKVVDFLNDAKERSVKTLSGGQTFQASLSLALALAESVQHQNKSKQNFFFLDEGFGTLDKHSLQMVFDAMKSLRKENRIVGVISHLEELQNEIDVFIQVTKDDNTGSKIQTSY